MAEFQDKLRQAFDFQKFNKDDDLQSLIDETLCTEKAYAGNIETGITETDINEAGITETGKKVTDIIDSGLFKNNSKDQSVYNISVFNNKSKLSAEDLDSVHAAGNSHIQDDFSETDIRTQIDENTLKSNI